MLNPTTIGIQVSGRRYSDERLLQHDDPYVLKTQQNAEFAIKNEEGIFEKSVELQHEGKQDYYLG